MIVVDPQNPVRLIFTAEIPTVLDKSKVNYGLAPVMTDGPSTQNLGTFVAVTEPGVKPAQL